MSRRDFRELDFIELTAPVGGFRAGARGTILEFEPQGRALVEISFEYDGAWSDPLVAVDRSQMRLVEPFVGCGPRLPIHGGPVIAGPPFEIWPGAGESPVVLHLPHSSTLIPADVRRALLLDEEELAVELERMTDDGVDVVCKTAYEHVHGPKPWVFVNNRSRLVIDPERFPDEREPMNDVGMGAVYNRTSQGMPLRPLDTDEQRSLLRSYYDPYADALADVVDRRVAATGRAVILDLHSYPQEPQPYEMHKSAARPDLCLGVDDFHSPRWLVESVRAAFAPLGSVAVNEPFAGSYVPLRHYRQDAQVSSVMLELCRDALWSKHGGPWEFGVALARVVEGVGGGGEG